MTNELQNIEHQPGFEDDLEIHYLVLRTDCFTVFLDKELDVDWKTTDEYDRLASQRDRGPHNNIMARFASLECTPNEHHRDTVRKNFKRMLAEGVAHSLKYDFDSATKILDEAEEYITNRNIESARFWQLSTSSFAGLGCVIIALSMWIWRDLVIDTIGRTVFFLAMAGVAGGIGAYLSIIFRIGNTVTTTNAEKKLHILEALSRIAGGSIAGLIIALLVKLGVIIAFFKSAGHTYTAMVAAGLFAGASERWVPSIIAQFEKDHKIQKEDPRDDKKSTDNNKSRRSKRP